MMRRLVQLEEWTQNPMEIPKVTWIAGLINSQAFLTAIMQVTAQKNQLELDKLVVQTEVKRVMTAEEIEGPSRDGALIQGMALQGARWDLNNGTLETSKPKEMFCPVPIINCRAILTELLNMNGLYECPTYTTNQRGPTYVFCAQLKTKSLAARWVLAGVAMIMDTS